MEQPPRLPRRHLLLGAAAGVTALLAGCGGGQRPADPGPGPAQVSSEATPPPEQDQVAALADYPGALRFTRTNEDTLDDVANARALVAMRTGMVDFLAWAREAGHPEMRAALPGDLTGIEYQLDPLLGNDESLDTVPLPGATRPFGRLVPDDETVKSYASTRQAGFALIMLKTMLSPTRYGEIVTNSPLVAAAQGKNILGLYPYTAPEPKGGDWFLDLMPGVRDAFREDPGLRWLIANPGMAMSEEDRRRLVEGGGTLHTAEGYRVVYIDTERAGYRPATVARTLYEALLSLRRR